MYASASKIIVAGIEGGTARESCICDYYPENQATALLLAVYAFALAMYVLAMLAVRAFHSRENMLSPVWAAVINMALNAVLSLHMLKLTEVKELWRILPLRR